MRVHFSECHPTGREDPSFTVSLQSCRHHQGTILFGIVLETEGDTAAVDATETTKENLYKEVHTSPFHTACAISPQQTPFYVTPLFIYTV